MVTATRPVYRILFPGLILGALALLVMVVLGDISQVSLHFIKFKWQYFALALAFNVVNHTLRFLKHSYHLAQCGVKGLPFKRRLKLFLSGSVLSATPLRVSESYKSVWLSQASGIPLNAADSLQLLDRISDILSVLVLATAGTLAFPSFWPFFLLVFFLFLGTTLSLQIKPAGIRTLTPKKSISKFREFSNQLHQLVETNPKAFSLGSISFSIVMGVLSWSTLGVTLFSILVGLGLPSSMASFSIACLVLSFSMLMGLVSRLPGGLGVIELAMAALLTILLNFRPGLAVAATVLFRLSTFWIDLLFGILFWSLTTRSKRYHKEAGRIVQG